MYLLLTLAIFTSILFRVRCFLFISRMQVGLCASCVLFLGLQLLRNSSGMIIETLHEPMTMANFASFSLWQFAGSMLFPPLLTPSYPLSSIIFFIIGSVRAMRPLFVIISLSFFPLTLFLLISLLLIGCCGCSYLWTTYRFLILDWHPSLLITITLLNGIKILFFLRDFLSSVHFKIPSNIK